MAITEKCLNLRSVEVVSRVKSGFGLSSPVHLSHHNSVTYHNSLEIELALGNNFVDIVKYVICQKGNKHASVRLSGDPKFIRRKLRETLEPLL